MTPTKASPCKVANEAVAKEAKGAPTVEKAQVPKAKGKGKAQGRPSSGQRRSQEAKHAFGATAGGVQLLAQLLKCLECQCQDESSKGEEPKVSDDGMPKKLIFAARVAQAQQIPNSSGLVCRISSTSWPQKMSACVRQRKQLGSL